LNFVFEGLKNGLDSAELEGNAFFGLVFVKESDVVLAFTCGVLQFFLPVYA